MKFLWLDINASYSHSSLALPALEAQLDQNIREKCLWKVVTGTIKTRIEEIIPQILEFQPQYIFATGWLFNIKYLLSVLSRTSAIDNTAKIVLGGPEFLGDNKKFLTDNPFVTAVFKGEGESVFNKFISIAIENPGSDEWKFLPGFEYINNNGRSELEYITKQPVITEDFPSLKYPETSQFFNWDKAFIQLETSRGCFNSCRFCVSGIDKSPVQNISIDDIRKRLTNISSQGIKEIRILDRTFNANPKRAIEMIDLFEEFKGELKFHLEVHPALLNDMLKERLSAIPEDLLHIEAGIQSLDEGVLASCARRGTAAQAIDGLKFLLGNSNYEVHTDFIAGLPGYSFEMLVKDIRSMIMIRPHEIQLELLKLLPGTCFRYEAGIYGIKYSSEPPYEVLQTPSISYKELQTVMVISKILEYWYNDTEWREVFADIVSCEPDFLKKLYSFLEGTNFMESLHSFETRSLILYNFCCENYPNHLKNITLQWIRCGLSLKKEPAKHLIHWNIKDNDINNPLFDPANRLKTYYYIDIESVRYWFAFNKSENRNKPVANCREII